MEDLVQFGCVNLKLVMIIHIKWHGARSANIAAEVFPQQELRRPLIAKVLLVCKPASKHKRVHARRPFMMPTGNSNWMLVFVEGEVRSHHARRAWVVVLEIVTRVIVLIFNQDQN